MDISAGETLQVYGLAISSQEQVPQLLENYKNGNAEGLSVAFLLTWMVGDVTSLIGLYESCREDGASLIIARCGVGKAFTDSHCIGRLLLLCRHRPRLPDSLL